MIHQFLRFYHAKDTVVGTMPEPQFRILLALAANGPQSTTALTFAPGTTALRHLARLVDLRLIERSGDAEDRRLTIYRLTRRGMDLMAGLARHAIDLPETPASRAA